MKHNNLFFCTQYDVFCISSYWGVFWKVLPIRHVQGVRLQRNNFLFSKTSWRRLEDVLKDEKFLRWRRIGDKQNFYWGYLHLANLNMYLANLYFTNLYLVNLRRIQNTLIRTQSGSRNEKNSGSGGSQVCNIVGHHSWPTKKKFYFKSSKTARKT